MKLRKRTLRGIVLVAITVLGLAPNPLCALELNRYFSDDMVLQRDKPLTIWGTAESGETVTVTFSGQTVKATADKDGRWVVTLKPVKANRKGETLEVTSTLDTRHSTLTNVLVGDVFLFARQSSIDVSLGAKAEGKEAAAGLAKNDAFRFIQIKTSPSRTKLANLKKEATKGWQAVDKKSALGMTAAAFYLGRDLAKDVKVPVGIVDLNMGYHFASAWMSETAVATAKDSEILGAADVRMQMALRETDFKGWDEGLYERKRGQWIKPRNGPIEKRGLSPVERPYFPSVCYNSVIHPLRGLVVKGMLLQLGNDYPFVAFTRLRNLGKITNMDWLGSANGDSYRINKGGNRMTPFTLPLAVDDLRRSLGDASLPTAWIMPPGSDLYQYGTHNREVREVQRRAQAEKKAIDLILPGADHVPMSGQPADEALLAARCTKWVLGTFYAAKTPVSGPVFDRVELGDDTATIHFKPGTADGLTADDDALKHFEVAGSDREFVSCKAEIDGSTIKLTSDTGSRLMYVRFGWRRKPVQGLVNGAGLPAIPFNTDIDWEYDWWMAPEPVAKPAEYNTAASLWPDRKYTIINKAIQGKSLHLGPTGLWGTPAGPNLYVTKVTVGSPADGNVFVGDVIYGVDGKEFVSGGDGMYVQFAAGITKAEANKVDSTMVLNIRREDELVEVPIKLEYMGSFSATSPWDCEKSERIVAKAEEYMRNGLRPKMGVSQDGTYMYGPWNDNVLFLMASGNPEVQGLVRRYVHQQKEAPNHHRSWGLAYRALLFGEYYHQTGDASVLPYLERLVVDAASSTPKVWPPTEPMRYGYHPARQMVYSMAMLLAKEAGIKVDPAALHFNVKHLHDRRAENGYILYNGYSNFLPSDRAIDEPHPIKPSHKSDGTSSSMNGKLGTGAALFSMLDGYDKAVRNCSERCVYAFNKTQRGHGGAWFNGFWTPIGAYHAGEEKYQHFMKGQQWWRELLRDHTGAVWQEHNAKGKASVFATGFVIHRVAHRKRLRMFGAPRSAFGPNAPAYLKPALEAHGKRDYALAETLIKKVLADGKIPAKDLPMVRHFLDSVQMVKKSVDYDLSYTEAALAGGEYYRANLELPQLQMVVAAESDRLKAIASALQSKEAKAQIKNPPKVQEQGAQASRPPPQKTTKAQRRARDAARKEEWLKKRATIDNLVKDGFSYGGPIRDFAGYLKYPREECSRWRLKVLETTKHTPEGWEKPDFDDSQWDECTLSTSWAPAHAALLRTTFEVKDKNAYSRLHIRTNAPKLSFLNIYLNGEVVAKVNNIKRGLINFPLTPHAMTLLKNGKNTLAVSTQHTKRTVYFSLRLEAYPREKKE